MADPRVLYITGWMRCGSTLLGNVLGELPGVLHVGELHYLWRNGVLGAGTNSTCGCGSDVTSCGLWSRVLAEGGDGRHETARRMVRAQHALLRTRHIRARLTGSRGTAHAVPTADAAGTVDTVDATLARTAAIYRRLAGLGGERLIVDGSKYPAEAAALLGRSDLDVRVLHMVRDPRPTAYSYKRAKDYIDPMSPARSSAYWTAFNLASELIGRAHPGRYLRVRHEDLCRDPRRVVGTIMRFAGLDGDAPVDGTGRVSLGSNHTVTGNPDRLSTGEAVIRADERWRAGLTAREIVAATGPALPLLARYGYPLLPIEEAASWISG
ncbi:sulfotransferase [Nonomuraea diastatica]|uniref:Sulfotransferase n=1 Tax=Nonomuraea diastatica TaxID=1848329 RepID=A0A4R4WXR0_9ACTN|nr:sulfotransferase [Nonomuraea diastatica]TDD22596.1 sulfotransferase [Nonomuraea diastatica]